MRTEKKTCSRPLSVGNGLYARCWSYDYSTCPSCAGLQTLYTKKLIGAGLEAPGYKFYLMTLTAPSFGKTHTVPHSPSDAVKRCACGMVHEYGSSVAGVPLSLKSYRFRDQVEWNNFSTELFRKSIQGLNEVLPGFAWTAVREFQKRGAVHLHVLVRVDASLSPSAIVKHLKKAGSTRFRGFAWGRSVDVRLLVEDEGSQTVRYLSRVVNYASKGSGPSSGNLSDEQKSFYKRLDSASSRLGYTEKMIAGFGFGGHSLTSSRNWTSLTREALKQEAREHAAALNPVESQKSVEASVDLNAAELRVLAGRLGSLEDYTVPVAYAADVRARVGLATPFAPVVSTSVESLVSAAAMDWEDMDEEMLVPLD